LNRRSISAARELRIRFGARVSVPQVSLSTMLAAVLRPFLTAERALPVAVAAIVAVASLLALLPNTQQGAVGGTQGSGTALRLAVGGGLDSSSDIAPAPDLAGRANPGLSFQPVTLPGDVITQPTAVQATTQPGAFLADGTLVTGYAPATSVQDGSGLVQTYRVKSGDTLVTVAQKFNVSMMTLWWANKLKSKDALKIGQVLRIPQVNGLVITVAETDTLASLAAKYGVSEERIIELNTLNDPTLVMGQVLVIPDAKGAPIPTPKPAPVAKAPTRSSSGSGTRGTSHSSYNGGSVQYSGGRLHWPVVGGNNFISQYFHYGHWAIDIAADMGSTVVAAAGGRVIFAGWKSNGGGWQVWISHGNGVYTTYNHMSAITVGNGQTVGRGQQVGRIGMSGDATGPHLHFEVWLGTIWDAGQRVNPMRYF
jgi:murein DD-endopeptidase MepM/ murein hydrolase activator NlpD